MDNERRVEIYGRDRGSLTPTQARRVRHRANQALAVVARPARARRRFDATRLRSVQVAGSNLAAYVRWRRNGGREEQDAA